MTDVTGKNLVVKWNSTAGTVNLEPDYRSFNTSDGVDLAETTAGADDDKTYIPTIKDSTIDLSCLYQSKGTVLEKALAIGVGGTLEVWPEGTATGFPKESYPAIVSSFKKSIPYNEVIAIDVTFQKNGPKTVS